MNSFKFVMYSHKCIFHCFPVQNWKVIRLFKILDARLHLSSHRHKFIVSEKILLFCLLFIFYTYRNSFYKSIHEIYSLQYTSNNKQKTFQFHCLTREASGIFILSVCWMNTNWNLFLFLYQVATSYESVICKIILN